jgi:PAS domain S-box-containing protein
LDSLEHSSGHDAGHRKGRAPDDRGTRRRERLYAVLVTLGHQLSTATTADAAARIIAEVAHVVFEWDAYSLALYDRQSDLIRGVLYFDLMDGCRVEIPPRAPADHPSAISRRTIDTGPQLFLRGVTSTVELDAEPFGDEEHLSESLMFVPLRSGVATVGVLSVQSYTALAYDRDDLSTLQVLADYCGGALERIAAQAAQRESEARFRALFEHSPDALFLIDPHATTTSWPIIDCNAVAAQMSGYTREELVGNSLDLVRLHQTSSADDEMYLAELRQGRTIHFESTNRRKDLTVYPIECSASLIQIGHRELVLEIDRDISERKLVEQRLSLRDAAGAVFTESLDQDIMLKGLADLLVPTFADWCAIDMLKSDSTTQWVVVNHAESNRQEQFRALESRSGLPPALAAIISQALRSGKPSFFPDVSAAMLKVTAQSHDHDALVDLLGVRSAMCVPLVARGRTLGVITLAQAESGRTFAAADLAFMQDLSDRAALVVDNARLFQEAQSAIRARDEFLSIAAHELRTPLTALHGYTQMLNDHSGGRRLIRPEDQKALKIMFNQTERLNRLINTLLDLSRLETGHFTLSQEPISLEALVGQVVTEIMPMLEHHVLSLEVIAPERPVMVFGDIQRLEQVFQNLIQNAIKYSPGGGKITVQVDVDQALARIAVRDPGIGIPRVALPYVFDRFYRAENTEGKFVKGMGIGLYVVNEIVTRHGGFVTVDSEEWNGSTFTVFLPLYTTDEAPPRDERPNSIVSRHAAPKALG